MSVATKTGTWSCLLLLAALLIPSSASYAQIELTADEVRGQVDATQQINSFVTEDGTGLQVLVDATGENQIYDFSSITFEQTLDGTFEMMTLPADVPGADDPALNDATFVQAISFEIDNADVDSTAWIFVDIEDDGVYSHGIAFRSTVDFDGDGSAPDDVKFTYTPRFQTLALPLTFGTTWTSNSTQTFSVGGQSFGIDVSLSAEVDGYGTLITPAGSASCLRVRRILETTTFGITTTATSFEFLTETGMSANITLGPSGQPISASYSTTDDTGTDVERIETEVPDRYHLAQNYPNPFNPQTTIRYTLPQSTDVRLAVYDALGREVEVLVDARQATGTYESTFDADGLASGIYVYRLQAGSVIRTQTMVLVE